MPAPCHIRGDRLSEYLQGCNSDSFPTSTCFHAHLAAATLVPGMGSAT